MRRKLNVAAKTTHANDEESKMLKSELQDSGMEWGAG
jgi:hypothetical protein